MFAALVSVFAPAIVEVAWSKSGTIATLTANGQVGIWSEKGPSIQSFQRNTSGTALALSEDGSIVAIGAENSTVVWWTRIAGRWTGPRSKPLNGAIQGVAISPDNKLLAGGCLSGFIYVCSAETGDFKRVFQEKGNGIGSLAFSPDSTMLASGGQTWRAWDPGIRAATRGGTPNSLVWEKGMWTVQVSYSPNGDLVAGIGVGDTVDQGHPKCMSIRKASDGSLFRSYRYNDQNFRAVDFAPDGRSIAIGTESGEVLLVDATTCQLKKSWKASGGAVNSLAFSPNSNRVLVGDDEGNAKMWSTEGAELLSFVKG